MKIVFSLFCGSLQSETRNSTGWLFGENIFGVVCQIGVAILVTPKILYPREKTMFEQKDGF